MTITAIAAGLAVERMRIIEYRSGKVTPSIMVVEELAAILGLEIVV